MYVSYTYVFDLYVFIVFTLYVCIVFKLVYMYVYVINNQISKYKDTLSVCLFLSLKITYITFPFIYNTDLK